MEPPARDFSWTHGTARDLTALRRTLGESGLGLSDIARLLPKGHEEQERWRDLARLEEAWLQTLDRSLGRCDREQARARAARQPQISSEIREVIVIGTPDSVPL